jgi:hypothetical protein
LEDDEPNYNGDNTDVYDIVLKKINLILKLMAYCTSINNTTADYKKLKISVSRSYEKT